MTATNADMTNAQLWVPLSEVNALALPEGFYTIDSENLQLSSFHMTHPGRAPSASNRPNGRICVRGVGGSTAATHSSGATLTRYYPDAPGGGGGGSISALEDVLAVGNTTGENTIVMPLGTVNGTTGAGQLNVLGLDGTGDLSGTTVSLGGGSAAPAGSGVGGSASLFGGDGGAAQQAGQASITGGYGDGGNVRPGQIAATGGDGNGNGGGAVITGAAGYSGSGGQGGDLIVTLGTGDGAGRHGLVFLNLPTSDPAVAGAAWNNSGTVKISAG